MELIVYSSLFIVIAVAAFIGAVIWLHHHMGTARREWSQELHEENQRIRQGLSELTHTLTHSLTDTRHSVQEDLKHSSLIMADIHGKLGELQEASRRIHDVGKNIASLQELLRAPKLRGGMGEYFLEDLLHQILPQAFFELQHPFQSGNIVDAVIRMGEHLVPIDAKFPLETFRLYQNEQEETEAARLRREFVRGVKKHIDDIALKYILPLEGTFDFALMYIPAENVYYEIIIKDADSAREDRPIFEYAVEKKVIPVSPNSIYAYLQVIVLGLRGFQIEGQAKEILSALAMLKNEFGKVEADFGLAARHLQNTTKTFDKARGRLGELGSKIHGIAHPQPSPAIADSGKVLPTGASEKEPVRDTT